MPEEPVASTITLTPLDDYAIAGLENQMLVATVKDQFGNPLPGVEVEFHAEIVEGTLTNTLGDFAYLARTDFAGLATVEWGQLGGDWGVEKIVALVGSSHSAPSAANYPTSNVSRILWAYLDGTGNPGDLVTAKPGGQQVDVHMGFAPWRGLTLRVSLKPEASELGSTVYSHEVENVIRTRHHTWVAGSPFFVAAADGRDAPSLVYDVVRVG